MEERRSSKRKSPSHKTPNTSTSQQPVHIPDMADMAEPFQELQEQNISSAESTQLSARKSQRSSQRRSPRIAQSLAPVSSIVNETPTKTPTKISASTSAETSRIAKQKTAGGTPVTNLSKQLVQLLIQGETPKNKEETNTSPARNTRSQKRNCPDSIEKGSPSKKIKPAFKLEEDEEILRSILRLHEQDRHAPISEKLWQKGYTKFQTKIETYLNNDTHNESKVDSNTAPTLTNGEQLLKNAINPAMNEDGSISEFNWQSALTQHAEDEKSLESGPCSAIISMPLEAIPMYMAALTGDISHITQARMLNLKKTQEIILDLTNPAISPLMIAAEKGHIEVLEEMKKAGRYPPSMWKSIMRAASKENPKQHPLSALTKYCETYDIATRHAEPHQRKKVLNILNLILNVDPKDDYIKRWRMIVLLELAPKLCSEISGLLAQVRQLSAETTFFLNQKTANDTLATNLSNQLTQLEVQEKTPVKKQEKTATSTKNTRSQKRRRSDPTETTPSKTTSEMATPKKINFDTPAPTQATKKPKEEKEEDVRFSSTGFVLSKNEKALRKALELDKLPEDAPISAAQWQGAFLAKPYKIPELAINKRIPGSTTRRIFALIAALTGDSEQLELALTNDLMSAEFSANEWKIAATTPLMLQQDSTTVTITPLLIAAERGAADVLIAMQKNGWPAPKETPEKAGGVWVDWLETISKKEPGTAHAPLHLLRAFFNQQYASQDRLNEQSTQNLIKVGEILLDKGTHDFLTHKKISVLLLKMTKDLTGFKEFSSVQQKILDYIPKDPTTHLYKAYADSKLDQKDAIQLCEAALRKIYPKSTPAENKTEIAIAWRNIARTEQRLGHQKNATNAYDKAKQFDPSVLTEADTALNPRLVTPSRTKFSWFGGNSRTAVNNQSLQQTPSTPRYRG